MSKPVKTLAIQEIVRVAVKYQIHLPLIQELLKSILFKSNYLIENNIYFFGEISMVIRIYPTAIYDSTSRIEKHIRLKNLYKDCELI